MRRNESGIGITLAALAVLAAGGLARAEESPQVAPAPPPATPENPTGGATPLAAKEEVATTPTPTSLATVDQTFMQKASELHATGAELAKLTEKNAGTEEVQALGQELLAEHTRSIAALREIGRSKNFELEASPTATQQATITEFAGKIGQAFDDSYRAQALTLHEEAILLFSNAAKAAKDADVRNFAELSLGDMKERHASMGGDAVKLKGEMALKMPKPSKTTTKNAKSAKGKPKAQPAATGIGAAPTASATPPASAPSKTQTQQTDPATPSAPEATTERATPAATASIPAAAATSAARNSTTPAAGNPTVASSAALIGAQPANENAATAAPVPRVPTPPAAVSGTSRIGTAQAEESAPASRGRIYDETSLPPPRRSTGTAAQNGRAPSSTSSTGTDRRVEPIAAREPAVATAGTAAPVVHVVESPNPSAQASIPPEVVAEGPARKSTRTRTTTKPARAASASAAVTSASPDDAAIATAPVARVVTRPASTSRSSSQQAAPATADEVVTEPRVIIREGPRPRPVRIFDDDDDD